MPPVRRRVRKLPVVDISDSSSQASEDNVPLTELNPKKNRVILHYATKNPDKPHAKMNGQYGMFSQHSPLISTASTKTLAKRKRATRDKGIPSGNKKKATVQILAENNVPETDEGLREDREESPLFEPEEGRGVQMQDDQKADAVILSPSLTPASKARLLSRKTGQDIAVSTRGNHGKRPIIIESESSCSDSDFDTNTGANIVASMPANSTPNISQALLTTSFLPGDASLIDDYIELLNHLAARERINKDFAEEEAAISLAVDSLPAEEKQHLATIAQACAKEIQADMATPSIATDITAIQAAVEKHSKEAEISRQRVSDLMAKKKEELQAQRGDIRHTREAALEKWKGEFISDTRVLEKTKAELEIQGGMAMAVELGRRLERLDTLTPSYPI